MSDTDNAAPSPDYTAAKAAYDAANKEYLDAVNGAHTRNVRNVLDDPDVKEKFERKEAARVALRNAGGTP